MYDISEIADAKAIYWAFRHYMHEATTCINYGHVWGIWKSLINILPPVLQRLPSLLPSH